MVGCGIRKTCWLVKSDIYTPVCYWYYAIIHGERVLLLSVQRSVLCLSLIVRQCVVLDCNQSDATNILNWNIGSGVALTHDPWKSLTRWYWLSLGYVNWSWRWQFDWLPHDHVKWRSSLDLRVCRTPANSQLRVNSCSPRVFAVCIDSQTISAHSRLQQPFSFTASQYCLIRTYHPPAIALESAKRTRHRTYRNLLDRWRPSSEQAAQRSKVSTLRIKSEYSLFLYCTQWMHLKLHVLRA